MLFRLVDVNAISRPSSGRTVAAIRAYRPRPPATISFHGAFIP